MDDGSFYVFRITRPSKAHDKCFLFRTGRNLKKLETPHAAPTRSAISPLNRPTANKRATGENSEFRAHLEPDGRQRAKQRRPRNKPIPPPPPAPYLHRVLAKSQAGRHNSESGERETESGGGSSASPFSALDVISERLRIEVRPASHYDARVFLIAPSHLPLPRRLVPRGSQSIGVLGFLVCLFSFFQSSGTATASAAFNSPTSLYVVGFLNEAGAESPKSHGPIWMGTPLLVILIFLHFS